MENQYFDESGHLTHETIAWVVDLWIDESFDEVPESVTDHIEECVKCKSDLFLTREVFTSGGEVVTKTGRDKKPMFRWYSVAAIILVLLATGSLLFYVLLPVKNSDTPSVASTNQTNTILQDSSSDSEKKMDEPVRTTVQENKEILVANFEKVPHLEILIGEAQRTGNFEMISPASSSDFKKEIRFTWKGDLKPDHIRIVNNREKEIFSSSLTGNEFLFKHKPEPGLYYWLIESNSEVISVGKFTVR